jgi:hypothetical protein
MCNSKSFRTSFISAIAVTLSMGWSPVFACYGNFGHAECMCLNPSTKSMRTFIPDACGGMSSCPCSNCDQSVCNTGEEYYGCKCVKDSMTKAKKA